MAKAKDQKLLNVQPHSDDAEQSVLGSMLAQKSAVSKAIQWLTPDTFYKDAHAKIFSVMVQLFNEGEPIDTVSVMDLLKKNKELEKVGGAYYITGLVEAVPTAAHIERYIKIVMEKSILRRLITLSHTIAQEAYEDSQEIGDILDSVEKSIFNITQNQMKGGFKDIEGILKKTFDKIDALSQHKGNVIGVPTGLIDLDEKTSGFQEGDLVIVAGRPGMGKTSLALSMLRNAAVDHGVGVGMFSLEMSNDQLAMRLLCSEARVDNHLLRTGKLPKAHWQKLSVAAGPLSSAPIFLDDTPGLTVLELRAKARRLKAEHNIQLIVVDYLQLMSGPKGMESRQQEISTISRSLKGLAKELEIPVIALSQLSRAVENRMDKRPQLSDLRESGAIEQDADIVMFLYRPELYSEDEEDDGKAQVIVAKQRNGPTGQVDVTFIKRFMRFENLAKMSEPF